MSCSTCGNGVHETNEACDDNNINSFDGCSSICAIEPHSVCYASGTGETCSCEPHPLVGAISADWLTLDIAFEAQPYIRTSITDPALLCQVIFSNANILGTGATCKV